MKATSVAVWAGSAGRVAADTSRLGSPGAPGCTTRGAVASVDVAQEAAANEQALTTNATTCPRTTMEL